MKMKPLKKKEVADFVGLGRRMFETQEQLGSITFRRSSIDRNIIDITREFGISCTVTSKVRAVNREEKRR